MKILHITDSHGTVKSPESRKDVYYISFLKKLYELGYVIKKENIDMVIHTGDLFHTARVSDKFAGQVSEMIKGWKIPVYVVPGNHDIEGYTVDTIDQTKLGLLAKAGVINILDRNNPITINVEQGNKKFSVAISGQEYYAHIDEGNMDDFEMQQPEADFNILAIHGYIADIPQHPNIKCTMCNDIVSDADVILAGHYHRQFEWSDGQNLDIFNPGSMMRVEQNEYNRTHIPQYGICDIHLNSAGDIEWSYTFNEFKIASPSDVVFDYNSKYKAKNLAITLDGFKTSIENSISQIQMNTNIQHSIHTICAASGTDRKIEQKAINIYNNALQSTPEKFEVQPGYIQSQNNKIIDYVTLTNFQSHKNTTIHFDEGLNIIAGESNSGKCVRGDSYVKTEFGLRQIKDLFTEPLIEDTFYDTNESVIVTGATEKLGALYYSGYKKSILISLSDGRELECSYEEPLLIWNPEKFCEEFKKACDLTVNDLLIRDVKPVVINKNDNNLQIIDWSYDKTVYANYLLRHENILSVNELQSKVGFSNSAADRNFYHRNNFNVILPKYLNADLAYVVGLIDGDGCISKGDYCTSDEFLKNEYTRIIKENFNKDVEFTERKGLLYTKGASGIFSLIIKGIMKAKGQNANTKKVPQIIKMSPWYIQLEYVKGIMDTDGSIDINGGLELSMNSKDIVLFVKEFVESIGYNGTLVKRGKSWRYNFSHSRFSTNHESLFRLPRKKAREIQKKKLTGPNKEILKGSAKWFKSQNISFTREQRKQISCHAILDYNVRDITVSAYNTFISKADNLGVHIERRIPKYHTVCSINSIKENMCDLYDVTNPISHTFTANGFIVHNTAILRGIMWAIDNQPLGNDFIMAGEDECSVFIMFKDGSFIERKRTIKDTGSYKIGFCDNKKNMVSQTFRGFTNAIPVGVANTHQMPKVNITKDIETHLNVVSQLEGPFLLTESPLVKASAIGRITGTHIIDTAIKESNKTIQSNRKLIKSYSDDLQDKESEYKQLPDLKLMEELLQKYNATVKYITKLNDIISKVSNNISLITQYNQQIKAEEDNITNNKKILSLFPIINRAIDKLKNVSYIFDNVNKHHELSLQIVQNKIKLDKSMYFNNLKPLVEVAISKCNIIDKVNYAITKVDEYNTLISVNKNTKQSLEVFYTNMNKVISYCKTLANRIDILSLKTENIAKLNVYENELITDTDTMKHDVEVLKSNIESIKQEQNKYILEHGKCPCCGQNIHDSHINSIVNFFKEV